MTIIADDDDMQKSIDKWIARKKFTKLLDLWIRGLNIDWNKLYGDMRPRRISLPTYPFAKERYWIQEMSCRRSLDRQCEEDVNMKSIEDTIDKIGDDIIETEQAVKELKMLVWKA